MTSTVSKYKKLSDIEHALHRPGMYLGNIMPTTANSWVVCQDTNKMIFQELTWNPAFLKIFDEVISNSVDESKRSSKLDTIKVTIDRATGEFSVLDNGGIPVEHHPDYDEYVPTLIFGYLRSGSNFDDTKDTDVTGQNGLGASLTNIFSTSFTVETSDGKKSFKQTWSNNMSTRTTPKISDG